MEVRQASDRKTVADGKKNRYQRPRLQIYGSVSALTANGLSSVMFEQFEQSSMDCSANTAMACIIP